MNPTGVLLRGVARTCVVPARPRWYATGIVLERGGTYRLHAEGTWYDRRTQCGPDGYPSPNRLFRMLERLRRHPGAPWFALIGTVERRRSTRFVIGRGVETTAPVTGELVCYANDLPMFHVNNSGEIRLTVSRRT